jgi:hypothetical protein
MKIVRGNILDAGYGLIGHQVNCQMVMGAGLAKQFRAKHPRIFTEYKAVMGRAPIQNRLGKCQIVELIPKRLFGANLFAQYNFRPRGVKHTDYTALAMALRQLNKWHQSFAPKDFPIYLPYGLGCGLAGGDWPVVYGIIEGVVPEAIVVQLP